MVGIGLIMMVGVYGIVVGIVKMDDFGVYLLIKVSVVVRIIGKGLLFVVFKLMKVLVVIGMVVMFMVGGGILLYGILVLYYGIEGVGGVVGIFGGVVLLVFDVVVGIIGGVLVLFVVKGVFWVVNMFRLGK